jgi:hypothetical protein
VIVDGLAGLPAFRVLVYAYDRTESLFVGMLMHVSITVGTLTLTPQTTGIRLLAYSLVFATAVWAVIAGPRLGVELTSSREPRRERAVPSSCQSLPPIAAAQ